MFGSLLLIFVVAFSQGVRCIPAPVPLSCANGALSCEAGTSCCFVNGEFSCIAFGLCPLSVDDIVGALQARQQSGTLVDTAKDLAIDVGGNDDAGVVEEATGGVANMFKDDQPGVAAAVEGAGKTSGELTRPVGDELEKDL